MSNIRRTVAALLLTLCAVGLTGVAAQADDDGSTETTPTSQAAGRHWDW